MASDKSPNDPAAWVNQNVVKFLLTWKPICNDQEQIPGETPGIEMMTGQSLQDLSCIWFNSKYFFCKEGTFIAIVKSKSKIQET